MSKASREREAMKNAKYCREKVTNFSKAIDIMKSNKSFDEKLDLLNHIIIGSNKQDWELRMSELSKFEEFEKFITEYINPKYSAMITIDNCYKNEEMILKYIGYNSEMMKENMSEQEVNKLIVEKEFTFKHPLSIYKALYWLNYIAPDFVKRHGYSF